MMRHCHTQTLPRHPLALRVASSSRNPKAQTTVTPVSYAPLWKRLLASLYDLLPLLALMFVITILLLPFTGGEEMPRTGVGHHVYQVLIYGPGALYYIWSWHRGGQTIGMRAWRLRVQTESGAHPDFKTACIRFGASLISIAVAGLGLLWALTDPKKRMWHDRWTGTEVIVVPKH